MAYNSTFTGQEIDRAIGTVRKRGSAWDAKQSKLTGSPGQLVGFDERGNAVAVDASGSDDGNYMTGQSYEVLLPSAAWDELSQSVYIEGISNDEGAQLIQPVPASADFAAYAEAEIHVSQSLNRLLFTCKQQPITNITVYVVVQNVRRESSGT